MKNLFKSLLILFFSVFVSGTVFAQIKVISPCEGVWANKQSLVLENQGKGDYYYSLNGTDPAVSGFAYDNPVLIDLKGDVTVRIVYIENGSAKDSLTIKYKVASDANVAKTYENFVASFSDSGILNYTAGSKLEIPSQLLFSLGKSLKTSSFLQGRTLKLSDSCVTSDYIPCVVLDEASGTKWRFLIRTLPLFAGIFSRRDVPFYITDWDTITFTNDDNIYRIDGNFWELPKDSKKIDRSVSHIIYWQSLAYETGNPIEFFVLPKKPSLRSKTGQNDETIYYLEGDSSYTMAIKNNQPKDYQELFSEFSVDAFYGDEVSGKLDLDIYSNSVYQGSMSTAYVVDKCPPPKPTVVADSNKFYSRKPVNVKISTDKESELYYSISEPYVIEDAGLPYNRDSELFKTIRPLRFIKTEKSTISMKLRTQDEGAVYFKISAYAKKGDYESPVTEFSVIIDQYNYYFDKNSTALECDGTANAPFNDFEQCLKAVNESRRSCIHLRSDVLLPPKALTLLSNCVLDSEKERNIVFNSGSSIIVKSASFEINNCQLRMKISNTMKNKTVIPLLKLENSVLDINDCNSNIEFGKTGTFVDASASTVNLNNCVLYVSAQSYVSCISGVKSRINIKDSILNANADTAVILSANEGDINLKNNSFKVTGSMGRVAEFFGIGGIAEDNKFQTDLSRHENEFYPIYSDKKSTYKDINNVGNGF